MPIIPILFALVLSLLLAAHKFQQRARTAALAPVKCAAGKSTIRSKENG